MEYIDENQDDENDEIQVLIRDECEMIRTTNGSVAKHGIHDISDIKFQIGYKTENNKTTKHWIVTLCFEDFQKINKLTNAN